MIFEIVIVIILIVHSLFICHLNQRSDWVWEDIRELEENYEYLKERMKDLTEQIKQLEKENDSIRKINLS